MFVAALFVLAAVSPFRSASDVALAASHKLDRVLQARAALGSGDSRVIIRSGDLTPDVVSAIHQAGGTIRRHLRGTGSHVAIVPNRALGRLAANPAIAQLSLDREIVGAMERTSATIGATAVRAELGVTGDGVGVALIDSGVAAHDDLVDPDGRQRVVRFVDFVSGAEASYDDYGHGTHVAGIIAGNGFDSSGARTGIAPGANLVVLKVLDATGKGHVSDVIDAIDYAIDRKGELNIRVINVSVAAGVYESYLDDPLTQAAERAVRAGIVVVAAAGNIGRSAAGNAQYGGITAPGNSPWVLTVGASSHMGTPDRADDAMAAFSSRGPTAIDSRAKPDLVAPGVGIESLATPNSTLYASATDSLLSGTVPTSYLPYVSLSGTSMSAPVVAGTVALMMQANPNLTPNQAKAILQFTAQIYPGYDPLTDAPASSTPRGRLSSHATSRPRRTRRIPSTRRGAAACCGGTSSCPAAC